MILLDQLFPFQRAFREWACHRKSVSLWAYPGTGKTVMSLQWALDITPPGRKLVVLTPSAVKWQWRSEILRWTGQEAQVLSGEKNKSPIDPRAPAYVCGYEILAAHAEALSRHVHTLILDESHYVKSHKRWKRVPNSLDPLAKPTYEPLPNTAQGAMRVAYAAKARLGCTATPLPDGRPRDLWAPLDLVNPRSMGTFSAYAKHFCDAKATEWSAFDTSGESNLDELNRILEPIVYFISKEDAALDLPPKRRVIVHVPPAEQVRAQGSAEEIRAAAKLGRAHMNEALVREACGRKRKVLRQMVGDSIDHDLKIIVFTGRRIDCDLLSADLRKDYPDVPMWCGHGGHSDKARESMRSEYMASRGPCVLVGTVDAWGTGLNLQDTDILYVAMLPWSPRGILQAEGRTCRIGQTRPVTISYLIADGTIDERIAQVILSKLPVVDKVLDDRDLQALYCDLRGGTDEELLAKLAEGWLK
jgi:SNF2 family DNA or RNA helicase